MSVSNASPGHVLDGRYELERRIAVGGMGQVWRGHDVVLDRAVAVKLLRDELVDDAGFRARFRQEARHAARVAHPAIAQVYDYAERSERGAGRAYLVMELVPGEPLSALLAREGRLPARAVLSLVAQTAEALAVAHAAGIVHRDIKPANLLLGPAGGVKVTDFGIARAAADAPVTDAGGLVGSPHYLAPEQVTGQPVTGAADVYALGVVAYEALTGRRPFSGDTVTTLAAARLHQAPPPLPDGVPAAVAALVMAMLSRLPQNRPAGAEVAAAARHLLAESAGQPALATDPPRRGGKRRALLLAGAGMAAVSAVAAVTLAALSSARLATVSPAGPAGPAPGRAGAALSASSPSPSASPRTVPAGPASMPGGSAAEVAPARGGPAATPAAHPSTPAAPGPARGAPSPAVTPGPGTAPAPGPTSPVPPPVPTPRPTPGPTGVTTPSPPAPSPSPTGAPARRGAPASGGTGTAPPSGRT